MGPMPISPTTIVIMKQRRQACVGIQILAEKDPKAEAVKVDSIIDNQFVRELETSGFIKNLYRDK
jgi:hypothetical protein